MMINKLYAALLRLYPRQFRTDFGVEMEDVFKQATLESKSQALMFFFRELRDLPVNLIHQHCSAIRKDELPMNTFNQIEESQPGTWGTAFMAGLPHLLISLLIGLGKLSVFDVYELSQIVSVIIGISLALLVVAVLIFAWNSGWPVWSASWYLYGTWVVIAIIGLTIENLDLQESWRFTNVLFFGWIFFCVIGYITILVKSKLYGLLSILFFFPLLGIFYLEFVPDPIEGWLAIGLGLLAAITAGAIVRIGEFRSGLWFVLGVNVVAGLSLAYVGEYQIKDLPPNAPLHPPKFSNFLELLGFYALFALGTIAVPFIVRGLLNFGKRKFSS
jgi:hypothetical protein